MFRKTVDWMEEYNILRNSRERENAIYFAAGAMAGILLVGAAVGTHKCVKTIAKKCAESKCGLDDACEADDCDAEACGTECSPREEITKFADNIKTSLSKRIKVAQSAIFGADVEISGCENGECTAEAAESSDGVIVDLDFSCDDDECTIESEDADVEKEATPE